jgi:hypothetical protein
LNVEIDVGAAVGDFWRDRDRLGVTASEGLGGMAAQSGNIMPSDAPPTVGPIKAIVSAFCRLTRSSNSKMAISHGNIHVRIRSSMISAGKWKWLM